MQQVTEGYRHFIAVDGVANVVQHWQKQSCAFWWIQSV